MEEWGDTGDGVRLGGETERCLCIGERDLCLGDLEYGGLSWDKESGLCLISGFTSHGDHGLCGGEWEGGGETGGDRELSTSELPTIESMEKPSFLLISLLNMLGWTRLCWFPGKIDMVDRVITSQRPLLTKSSSLSFHKI